MLKKSLFREGTSGKKWETPSPARRDATGDKKNIGHGRAIHAPTTGPARAWPFRIANTIDQNRTRTDTKRHKSTADDSTDWSDRHVRAAFARGTGAACVSICARQIVKERP